MAAVAEQTGHVINGELVTGTGDRIEVINPATEQVIGSIPAGTAEEVDRAVAAARAAQREWEKVEPSVRAEAVRKLSAGLAERRDDLAATITAEMGSPIGFSSTVQAGLPVFTSAGVADIASSFHWTEEIGNSLIVREAIGVVGAITPWNYPLHQVVAKVAPAIAAGCSVVLKPSAVAPLSANILAEVVAKAGIPDGVVNVVHGRGTAVGEAIARHPDVDMISFTGSTGAGRRVAQLGAETIKRVALELGGKSAAVICQDADLAKAVKVAVGNCYINGGQTCSAWTRLLVPADRQDEIAELVVAAASGYNVGDPTQTSTRIGPMVSADQRETVTSYIRRGVDEGANLVLGGAERPSGFDTGYYVQPSVFTGVRRDMTIAQEEIFGPVLSIMPYDDEDEAIDIANSTVYGLAGGVFAGTKERAIEVARRIKTGQVDVNGGGFNPVAPFGGYRQSGNGRELGRFGLEEFLEIKSIQR